MVAAVVPAEWPSPNASAAFSTLSRQAVNYQPFVMANPMFETQISFIDAFESTLESLSRAGDGFSIFSGAIGFVNDRADKIR